MYSSKCGDDIKNKMKGVSKAESKHIKFEEYKTLLGGRNYKKECDKRLLRSINHEMHLQQLKKSFISIFDVKRCYINETESIPWYWKIWFWNWISLE